jgi:outer membrane protein assembly factor BamB
MKRKAMTGVQFLATFASNSAIIFLVQPVSPATANPTAAMHTCRFSLLVAAVSVSTLAAGDWDRFRGPDGFGTAADKDVPVVFGPTNNVLWKTPIPGVGHSSPIVSKGKVFLQTASSDKKSRSLVCVDVKSGKIEWSKDVAGSSKIDWTKPLAGTSANTHGLSSHASSTPAADGERVYTVFWDGVGLSLTAFDYSGNKLWDRDLGPFKSQHGAGHSPMVVDGRVIVNDDQDDLSEVFAFDAKTGAPAWKKSRTAYRACYTTPFVLEREGKKEVIVSCTAGITAYDPKDGAVNWEWKWVWKPNPKSPNAKKGGSGGPLRQVGGPIFHQGMIFAISGDGGGDRHMVAIKAGTKGDVTDSALVWEKKAETAYVPMVLAHGDYVFWVTDKENKAICVEAKTGKEMWNERLGGTAQVTASPVLIDGKIYSINMAGKVFVYAAKPKFDLLAENDLKEDVSASPAVADGKLYIRGEKHLFCIGKK